MPKSLSARALSPPPPRKYKRRAGLDGFTLAEVLITLAIIGVIAALTIPNLMSNYRKSVVVSRLQKSAAQIAYAYKMGVTEQGSAQGFTPKDKNAALEMFNTYYTPYLKIKKVEKGIYGVFAYLEDGSALYFRKEASPESWSDTYMYICITHKACQNITDESNISKIANGKNIFGWYTNGYVPTYTLSYFSHSQRIEQCKNRTKLEACGALIYEAGWKIPDDYPIKI